MTILKAIVSGETDPVVLSELAEGRARDKFQKCRNPYKDGYQNIRQKMLETSTLGIIRKPDRLLIMVFRCRY